MSNPAALYSYADYQDWYPDGDLVELIDGRPWRRRLAPGMAHQVVVDNLRALLQPALVTMPGQMLTAAAVRLSMTRPAEDAAVGTVVRPDLCVASRRDQVDGRGCVGAPAWVIEVLAAGSTAHDLKTKFDLYQRFGVAEYWLVTPELQCIIVYVLASGRFQLQGEYVALGDVPVSSVPGLSLPWAAIFAGV